MKTQRKHLLYRYSRYIKSIFFIWDLVLLNTAYVLAFLLRNGDLERISTQEAQNVWFIINLAWFALYLIVGAYKFLRVEHIEKIVSKSLQFVLLHLLLVFTLLSILDYDEVSRLKMGYFYGLLFVFIFIFRIVFIKILKHFRRKGFNFRRVVIIGATKAGKEIAHELVKDLAYGYQVAGFFDDKTTTTEDFKVLGTIDEVPDYVLKNNIHEIYMAVSKYNEHKIKELIKFCERHLIRIKFVPNFQKITDSRRVFIDFYGRIPIVSIRKEPLENPLNRIVKRLFDIVFSLLLIVLVFPWLFPILIVMVACSSRGPIFFKQLRSGENNQEFYCYKFRSMQVNKQSDQLQATANDSRVTRVGRFMRKTNLDELPQFFNVLFGKMSVVGPRPHMLKHTEEFSEVIDNYLVRHYTRPGITGVAQIKGYRGETKKLKDLEKRVELDIWYIENWSFFLDLKIIFLTAFGMLRKQKNAV